MRPFTSAITFGLLALLPSAQAILPPERPSLPNYDWRLDSGSQSRPQPAQGATQDRLRISVPEVRIDYDAITSAPKWVRNEHGFLSGPNGRGLGLSAASIAVLSGSDSNRALKAFLAEYSGLFGFGAEALDAARVTREFVSPHNGLRTIVFQQQFDGITVFEASLIAHTTKANELVSVCSGFVSGLAQAADLGTPKRAILQSGPTVSGNSAVALAAGEVGTWIASEAVSAVEATPTGPERLQHFRAPGLQGDSETRLVWLPLDGSRLRLCWEVILTSRMRGEMFRVLLDAETGEGWVLQGLTCYLTNATYRVFMSDSPSPFSPGFPTPTNSQPPLVSRSLVTLSALDTNASPNGWMDDGVNETRGNNVDAHTDRDNNDLPDLPRPQGSPFRVFDFAQDLNQSPTTYTNASVVQLFYWNNWMHDRLYQLGFTEAAGNFQNTNFGRGGLGGDAVQADAQDGGGNNNANFSTPPDGYAGRMQMYIFTGPTPARDGDLDAEVVLHEYTHGLSNRRVGGGVGISQLQPAGMGEGWSDFYGMTLLSESGDDVNGVYATGGYATYQLAGLTQNYYFGIRRYPYCTDLAKNPLTFKDIDPGQASSHTGVPRSPIIGSSANEVHNMGEVWCVTLWQARANLITKYGWAVGNQLVLQLVTDGMNLSPANPNFLQARDAILQADMVDTGGANSAELWAAFSKRGMGVGATSPSSSTTTGVHESFGLPGEIYTLAWSPIAAQGVNQPFGVLVTALDALNNVATNFSGTVALSCSRTGLPPAVLFSPTVSGHFTNGVWNGSITVLESARSAVLRADDGLGHAGSSNPFNVTPTNQLPIILNQPADQTVYVGMSASFSVDADGTPPLSYQWSRNGTNLAGATDTLLTLSNVQLAQAGTYIVTVSNAIGLTPSSNAVLTVNLPPPCAPISSGLAGWWRAENDATDALGANSGTLMNGASFASGLVGQGFNLNGVNNFVKIPASGSLNAGLGSGLTLEAWIKPSLVDSGHSIFEWSRPTSGSAYGTHVWVGHPSHPAGYVFANIADTDGGYHVIDLENAVVAGQFQHLAVTYSRSTGIARIFVNGAVVRQVSLGSFTPQTSYDLYLGCRPPGDGYSPFFKGIIDEASVYNRELTTNEVFVIYLANAGGKCGLTNPPVITLQPTNVTVLAGATVSFAINAVGATPLSYQWSFNGTNLAGASTTSLVITNVQLSQAGLYAALVTNAYGFALSSNAVLTVNPSAPTIVTQPVGLLVSVGSNASFSVTATGTAPLSYQWRVNGGNLAGQTTAGLTLTNVQMTNAGSYSVLVTNGGGFALSSDAVLVVVSNQGNCLASPTGLIGWWRAEGDAADTIGTNNGLLMNGATFAAGKVGSGFSLNGSSSFVKVPASPTLNPGLGSGLTLEAWIKPSDVANGHSVFEWCPSPSGSSYGTHVWVGHPSHPAGYVFANLADTSGGYHVIDAEGAVVAGQLQHLAITYSKTTGIARMIVNGVTIRELSVGSFTLQTSYDFYLGCRPPGDGYHPFFAGIIDEASVYNRELTTNEVLAIYNAGAAGKCVPIYPPAIVTQPTNRSVLAGSSTTFTVAASGTPPLIYQWSFNGTNVAGATATSLTLASIQAAQAGSYSVLVTNLSGSTNSSNAVLNVLLPPTIKRQPLGLFVVPGCDATFTVVANGTAPLRYQWQKDGVKMNGQTNSTLALTSIQTSDYGAYQAVVTNSYGAITSSIAQLATNHPPTAVPDTVVRFASGGVRIRAATLLANDSDVDGDRLSVAEVGSSSSAGGSVSLSAGWIYYLPPPGYTNIDTFLYTVADSSCGGRAVAQVTILTQNDDPPISELTIESLGDGSYRLSVDGLPGGTYRLLTAPVLDATNWVEWAAGMADAYGVFQSVHIPPSDASARFYRAVTP